MADTATRLPLLELQGEELSRVLGKLELATPDGKVSLPLAGVEINARVAERVAEVSVTEVFRNTYRSHLEAVYIFPLGGGSAVSDFELKVKDRVIKGVVEERAEARRQYNQAVSEGKRAALLEKERDDVFTVQVGNLPPGEEVTVKITYSERLPFFEDGSTELRLPLVVGERYIPGSPLSRDSAGQGTQPDTDAVPDASRITPPRLAPGVDPKVALKIRAELLPASSDGIGLADLQCSQHATRTAMSGGAVIIELSREDEPLNRDFILRWRLAGEKISASFLRYKSAEGPAYGMISVVPPHREGFLGVARDVVFVLDRSGSMEGPKMASAARACSLLLATLEPRDHFAILAFDDHYEWMGGVKDRYFINANESGIEAGNRFLRKIDARGGTELDGAIREALQAIAARRMSQGLPIIVVITDGQIGDESRVLKRLQKELGDARVFTVGIDTAVNEGFLSRLANTGGGTAAFVTPGENLDNALLSIGREIGNPVVVDVSIEDISSGLEKDSVTPAKIPDLFAGRATTAYVRLDGKAADGKIKIRGRFIEGGVFEETLSPRDVTLQAVSHLWARARIADLEDRFRISTQDQVQGNIKGEIIAISKAHSVLSRFTAFIVVDESEIVNKEGAMRTVAQPVEMPAQWEMKPGAAASGIMPRMMKIAPQAAAPPQSTIMGAFPAAMQESFSVPELSMHLGSAGEELMDECRACFDIAEEPPCFEEEAAPPVPSPMAFTAKPRMEAAPVEKAKKPALKPGSAELSKAIEDLEKVLADVIKSLKEGKLPDPALLEKARTALIGALADTDLGQSLPKLQRFLRAAAIELIQALKTPAATIESLIALFEKHMKSFVEARDEALQNIPAGSKTAKDGERFWESTI